MLNFNWMVSSTCTLVVSWNYIKKQITVKENRTPNSQLASRGIAPSPIRCCQFMPAAKGIFLWRVWGKLILHNTICCCRAKNVCCSRVGKGSLTSRDLSQLKALRSKDDKLSLHICGIAAVFTCNYQWRVTPNSFFQILHSDETREKTQRGGWLISHWWRLFVSN